MEYLESVWTTTKNSNVIIDIVQDGDKSPGEQQRLGSREEITAIVIILCIFSVIGMLGNGLVLYVFKRTVRKLTSTIFILALAITDFITCMLIIPLTVVAIQLNFALTYEFVCKVYQFLITCNVPLSAFIIVAIAVDRYISICHPLVHIITVKRAKFIVYILASFAVILGIITSLIHGVYVVEQRAVNTTGNIIMNQDVVVYTGFCHISTTIIPESFINVYQKIFSLFFLISLLIVMVLYSMVYSSVTKQRAKRRKQKMGIGKKVVSTQCQTDESTIFLNNRNHNQNRDNHKLKVEMEGVAVSISLSKNNSTPLSAKQENGNMDTDVHAINRNHSHRYDSNKEKRDHERLANIKNAAVLSIVTLVFIISFLPAWLIALRWATFNVVVFYMYFVHNVANPFIYAFMNKMFQEKLRKFFAC